MWRTQSGTATYYHGYLLLTTHAVRHGDGVRPIGEVGLVRVGVRAGVRVRVRVRVGVRVRVRLG